MVVHPHTAGAFPNKRVYVHCILFCSVCSKELKLLVTNLTVFDLVFASLQLPTKRELVAMIETEGMEAVSSRHLKLTKRRLTKEQIKENNMTGGI